MTQRVRPGARILGRSCNLAPGPDRARRTGERLVTGSGTNICATCLDLCDKILTEGF